MLYAWWLTGGSTCARTPTSKTRNCTNQSVRPLLAGPQGPAFLVRPARAHSCRLKCFSELATASEMKRNCGRATDFGEKAWIVNREPRNKKRIRGTAEQGKWAKYRGALVAKAMWC